MRAHSDCTPHGTEQHTVPEEQSEDLVQQGEQTPLTVLQHFPARQSVLLRQAPDDAQDPQVPVLQHRPLAHC
jgi:hypothetical protein